MISHDNMTGKSIIQKELGNYFWPTDMKAKNARGKKHAWAKAEAKNASRKFRRDKSYNEEF